MKIAVLFGGISTERNVSISGGKAVMNALRKKGHEVIPIDPAFGADALEKSESVISDIHQFLTPEDLKQFSKRSYIECINLDIFDEIDAAFIVLHGKYGEDGLIQALLEFRGVPYTGSDVKASSLAMDKDTSKLILGAADVLTPQWTVLMQEDTDDLDLLDDVRKMLGNEIVVKPNDQGSTIGISIIRDGNLDDLSNAVKLAGKYSRKIIVERYIEGRELTVAFVGDQFLPVIEIVPEKGFYDYEAKFTKGKTEYICPADISEDIAEFMTNHAVSAAAAIGCSGFGRVDFRLNDEGLPICLEANTIPGFTEMSLVPMAAKEAGIDFPELCEKIVEIAINDHKNKK